MGIDGQIVYQHRRQGGDVGHTWATENRINRIDRPLGPTYAVVEKGNLSCPRYLSPTNGRGVAAAGFYGAFSTP